jgi:hypothetical protein
MTIAGTPPPKEAITAALLVIGDKILSGRTKDQNIGYVAEYLTFCRRWKWPGRTLLQCQVDALLKLRGDIEKTLSRKAAQSKEQLSRLGDQCPVPVHHSTRQ